jgi:polyisoprenoid-binding protein YceI
MSTSKWVLDPTHSELQFKVKHLMITTVTGNFGTLEAEVSTEDEDFSTAVINFRAAIDSISTGNEQRDGHLKSDDFFSAEKFPYLTFASTSIEKNSNDELTIHGDLTIRDVTNKVSLKAELGGIAKDPWGNLKAGFTVSTIINRKDFGLTWNAVTESGGVLVSEDVRLAAEVQFVKQ